MPNRIIHDKARRSPTLKCLSDGAERGWWRLTTVCDDYGRFDGDPEVLLSQCFERRPAGWTLGKMTKVLAEWLACDLVHLYATDDDPERVYGHVVRFTQHQRERDSKPKYPDPPCGNSPPLAAKCGESRLARARSESREPRDVVPRAESREAGRTASGGTSPRPPVFQIPESIRTALSQTRRLAQHQRFQDPAFWQAQIRARAEVAFPTEILAAEAWLEANPKKAPKSDYPAFLQRWFTRSAERLKETHG